MSYNLKCNLEKNSQTLDHIVHNAMLMGYAKNKNFLAKLIDRNVLSTPHEGQITNSRKKENAKRVLFECIDVFNRKFDSDWDIVLAKDRDRNKWSDDIPNPMGLVHIAFVWSYPEYNITNTRGETHPIKGMMPILYLTNNGDDFYLGFFTGTRLVLSELEALANYRHSHMPSLSLSYNNIFHPQNFCQGGGDTNFLLSEQSRGHNAEQLEVLLYSIDAYVKWESIEGGPHYSMNKIAAKKAKSLANYGVELMGEKIVALLEQQPELVADFYYHEGRYRIRSNKKWDEYLKKLSIENFPEYPDYFCKQHLVTKQYYSLAEQAATTGKYVFKSSLGEEPYIILGQQKVYFKVETPKIDDRTKEDLNTYIIYPKLSDYVIDKCEQRLYNAAVRQSAVRAKNTATAIAADIAQD